jgi:SAM-dependent methyltransferase
MEQITFEEISCPLCGNDEKSHFRSAVDDLTGKPGLFHFVRCHFCDYYYQNPVIPISDIGSYYDSEYVVHKTDEAWGVFGRFVNWAKTKHDREKVNLVQRFVSLSASSNVLDVGCATGSFLAHLVQVTGARVAGVDFKDLIPKGLKSKVNFFCGLFYESAFNEKSFDLITMWHFLEHCYEPQKSLQTARKLLKDDGLLIIEVPNLNSLSAKLFGNRWPGLQAPQHVTLFTESALSEMVKKNGFEVVHHLTYGAFPRFFYFYTGLVFHFTKGKGIELNRHVIPYLIGSVLFAPFGLIYERFSSLSMQTVVCRKAK